MSGKQRLNFGGDDKKEDDWEKLSRISRRTTQTKKPANLEVIEDNIRTLQKMQLDLGRKNLKGRQE